MINEFTGKRLKFVFKTLFINGQKGLYCLKTDTTPDDPDYQALKMDDELQKEGIFNIDVYVNKGLVKSFVPPSRKNKKIKK